MENFQDMEGLVLNLVKIPVEIQDMENFQNMDFLGFGSSTSHTIYHKTIGVRK